MIAWSDIETVLLDMDGTLLDLHFDSHFWREHLPARYAYARGIPVDDARAALYPMLEAVEGTIQWYCLDYWGDRLGLDLVLLKQEVQHLIAVHPHVLSFLGGLRAANKRTVLVTNAHRESLGLKLRRTRIDTWFDDVVCAHDLGLPKEQPEFWDVLHRRVPFDRERTLLVDDSLPVLRSARRYGVGRLLAVSRPDSRQPPREVAEFTAIQDFSELPAPAVSEVPSSQRGKRLRQ